MAQPLYLVAPPRYHAPCCPQPERHTMQTQTQAQTQGTGKVDRDAVEELGGIAVLRGGGAARGWNGIHYQQGLSAKNVGSTALSVNVATVPPGAIAYAHIHDGFEVMLYIVQGKVKHTFGEGLTREVINEAGGFIYIKPDVPPAVSNFADGPL